MSWRNESRRHALAAKGVKTTASNDAIKRTMQLATKLSKEEQEQKLQKLKPSDYDLTEGGAKVVTWSGLDKREKNLYILQDRYREKMLKELKSYGYEIEKVERVSDGWGTGFKIDKVTTKDKRTGETKVFYGNDDNSTIMQEFPSGGRGSFAKVPGAKPWYKVEGEL